MISSLRGLYRKIRSKVGIRSSKVAIRTHVPWYVRIGSTALMMGLAAAIAWWLVDNSYRITGFNREEANNQILRLSEESNRQKRELEAARSQLTERERQIQIERAAQAELARNLAQLQEENAGLKEDIGFLRNIMSSGNVPEGLSIQNLKVEPDTGTNDFRYRMLLIQGGQRKQDFKGKVQVVVRVAQSGAVTTLAFPTDVELSASKETMEFRYYQKLEGRFTIPPGSLLKSIQVRVVGVPGGEQRASKTLTIS